MQYDRQTNEAWLDFRKKSETPRRGRPQVWIKGSSSWAAHVGRLVRRRPFPWPPFVERPWLSSPPVWHTPPSAAHAAGAVQARPTLLSVLQHWVAGLMHRPPHLTLPEGQAAREKGDRSATRCRHEHVASLPLPMFAFAKLRDAALQLLSQRPAQHVMDFLSPTASSAIRAAGKRRGTLQAGGWAGLAALGFRVDALAAALGAHAVVAKAALVD